MKKKQEALEAEIELKTPLYTQEEIRKYKITKEMIEAKIEESKGLFSEAGATTVLVHQAKVREKYGEPNNKTKGKK